MKDVRWILKLALGAVMVGLGGYVAIRPVLPANSVLTGARWLDALFAAFFIIRGLMHVRAALRMRRAASP